MIDWDDVLSFLADLRAEARCGAAAERPLRENPLAVLANSSPNWTTVLGPHVREAASG